MQGGGVAFRTGVMTVWEEGRPEQRGHVFSRASLPPRQQVLTGIEASMGDEALVTGAFTWPSGAPPKVTGHGKQGLGAPPTPRHKVRTCLPHIRCHLLGPIAGKITCTWTEGCRVFWSLGKADFPQLCVRSHTQAEWAAIPQPLFALRQVSSSKKWVFLKTSTLAWAGGGQRVSGRRRMPREAEHFSPGGLWCSDLPAGPGTRRN
jgi:hypothetical protein